MYQLQPSKVYYLDAIERDPRAVARMERMIAALATQPETVRITDQNLPDVMADLNALWPAAKMAANGHASWRRPPRNAVVSTSERGLVITGSVLVVS